MIKKIFLLSVVSGLILCPCLARSENVLLKSGKIYQGEISTHSDSELELMTSEGLVQIPYRMIESVTLDPKEETSSYPMFEEVLTKIEELKAREEKRNVVYGKNNNQEKVELYMTSWCPYCRKMENYLQKNNIDYVKYNIEYDQSAHSRYKKMRGNGVPLIKIGSKIIRGYNPSAVSRAIR